VIVPLLPVMGAVNVPRGVVLLVFISNVDVPPATTELGVKVAVTLDGSPCTPSDTVPEKPLSRRP
jgi:hypothetical protein